MEDYVLSIILKVKKHGKNTYSPFRKQIWAYSIAIFPKLQLTLYVTKLKDF
jgi:hypothetical protein